MLSAALDLANPEMAKLPDIDEYVFKSYPPISNEESNLPEISPYYASEVLSDIINKKVPFPFSREVLGSDMYFIEKKKEASAVFDW